MANVAALPIMLKALRLACFNTHWESVAQKATAEQWMPEQYLAELCAMGKRPPSTVWRSR